jgi:mono/diheme cytochrome c family protein
MKRVLKWIGLIFAGLIGLIVVVVVGLAIYASASFKPTHADRPLYPITADTSPAGLARGQYLMEGAMACADACHAGENEDLSGFVEEVDMFPISALFAVPNLTPDQSTGLGGWTDAEIARAIREGVDKDGVELIIMPSYNYNALSDADVAAIVGYLRGLEPVSREIPPIRLNWVGKIMLALGAFGQKILQEPITAARETPPAGTAEYGQYLVALGACTECHQANLAGGPLPFSEPDAVPAANLTPAGELPGWTVEQFIAAVTEGMHPAGTALDEGMPRYGMTAEDLAAIFAYLQTIPAVATTD